MSTKTKPTYVDPMAQTRANRASAQWEGARPDYTFPSSKPRRIGCTLLLLVLACLVITSGMYLLAPFRTNILLLGIDRAPEGTDVSRSDTIILLTILPLRGYVGMLSIPRDLWLNVPGVGENRINTAHFFAENENQGSGPKATMETIRQNFGVRLNYYVRVRFDGIQEIVDALGGLDLELDSPTSGYPAGRNHLDGTQALAFVRDRAGADDFFRMKHGQLFLKAMWREVLNPATWPRLPAALAAFDRSFDTNIPVWQWPRIGLAMLRAGPDGIDNRVIDREMVTPFTTSGGAQVLNPNWSKIDPVIREMFGAQVPQ
jgi:LCP family protein required for cell wall assembly